jgi:hypothetical protein
MSGAEAWAWALLLVWLGAAALFLKTSFAHQSFVEAVRSRHGIFDSWSELPALALTNFREATGRGDRQKAEVEALIASGKADPEVVRRHHSARRWRRLTFVYVCASPLLFAGLGVVLTLLGAAIS